MLVNLKNILQYAEEHKCAIGSFNTPTLENIVAVISQAEKLNVPVIIMHAECHENESPLELIGPVMVFMAQRAKVPVCVHLDHGEDIPYLKKALDIGFTSIMFDGSLLPYEENVKLTIQAREMAHKVDASIEAEIGVLGGREAGDSKPLTKEEMYTDPDLALKFVEETKIDALACSFGTAHGFYKVKPQLDFPRIVKISKLTHLPLVMHGGSGVAKEDYIKAIECGIRKINYYSYMGREGVLACKEICQSDISFYHEIAAYATKKMAEDVYKAMRTFYRLDC